MSNASVIRPGLLVSLNTSIKGGVSYQRVDINTGEKLADGAVVSEWKTKRTIDNPTEHEAACKVRSNARAMVSRVCSSTSFGLLCPEDQEGALDAAIRQAREMVDAFNTSATVTRVGIFVIKGRVASNDAEAARAITQEIGELVTKMDAGIKEFDPEAIREAASRARELSSMLDDKGQTKVNAAIEQARKAARTIVQRVQKDGEDKAIVMMDIQRGQIESARIAFLDMSDPAPVGEAMPAVNAQRFAELDVDSEPKSETLAAMERDTRKAAPARAVEMEL